MKAFLLVLVFSFGFLNLYAQDPVPFRIRLEPMIPKGFTGLQSYAWARSGNKILLVGGRTDGLHRPQPFAAFRPSGQNGSLVVIDLNEETTWKKDLSAFPVDIAEQLQSTNMEFFQDGNTLVLAGGYGYSATRKTHLTYPSLLRIQVDPLIRAIIDGTETSAFIQRVEDERMAVTGGRMGMLNGWYYLVGGQRFEGRYNPHGPDHGPGFSQRYTNQVRKFRLKGSGSSLQVENYSAITDSVNLHRRDYNLLAQKGPDGKEWLTIYSGVFQYEKNVPFTTLVDIHEYDHTPVPGFNQLYSHYHTATLPVYSHQNRAMYSVFFGGIARYYPDSAGTTQTDNDIPFVKSISVVERTGDGIREYLLPDPMPGYFGAAAEFIPADPAYFTSSGILDFDKTGTKSFLAGYILGGIDSRAPNVFWSNGPEPSRASPVIWKVFLHRN